MELNHTHSLLRITQHFYFSHKHLTKISMTRESRADDIVRLNSCALKKFQKDHKEIIKNRIYSINLETFSKPWNTKEESRDSL